MILTCPECATSYFVDDARIPPEGRRVKCTSCGARWLARPEAEPEVEPFEPAAAAEPDPILDATEAEAEAIEPPVQPVVEPDDLVVSGPEPVHLRPRPTAAGSATRRKPERSEGRSAAVLWGGMAALVAALVAGAVVFREDLVRLWPQSSAAFAGVGLEVPGGGLVIEQVKAEPIFVAGRPALEVRGAIRNARGKAQVAPPIRVSLLDRAGKPVAAKIGRPIDPQVPGKAVRHFALAILDPPADASDLEVTFAPQDVKSDAYAAPAAAEAADAAPAEAQPHPADSPDVHPDHG